METTLIYNLVSVFAQQYFSSDSKSRKIIKADSYYLAIIY